MNIDGMVPVRIRFPALRPPGGGRRYFNVLGLPGSMNNTYGWALPSE